MENFELNLANRQCEELDLFAGDNIKRTLSEIFIINKNKHGRTNILIPTVILEYLDSFVRLVTRRIDFEHVAIIERDTCTFARFHFFNGEPDDEGLFTRTFARVEFWNPKGTWTIYRNGDTTNISYTPTIGSGTKPSQAGQGDL